MTLPCAALGVRCICAWLVDLYIHVAAFPSECLPRVPVATSSSVRVSFERSTGARMGATHRASKGKPLPAWVGPAAESDHAIHPHAARESSPFSRRILVWNKGFRSAFALGQAHGHGYFVRPRAHLPGLSSRKASPTRCWKHPCRLGRSASRNEGMLMKIGKRGWEGPWLRGASNKGTPACQTLVRYKIFPTGPTVEGAIT